MKTRDEDVTSKERYLTESICRDLTCQGILFEQEFVCKWTRWDDWGYIDIFVKSLPPCIIEVKGSHHPSTLYYAIGQLLCYSACFPTASLYLAVPDYSLVAPRIIQVLERVGIHMWTGSCQVCGHRSRVKIEAAIAEGRKTGVIAQQFRLSRLELLKHEQHRSRPDGGLTDQQVSYASPVQVLSDGSLRITGNPLSQFKQAWHLAKDDTKTQRRMMCIVVEDAVQDEGLKRYLYDKVQDLLTDPEMGL